jgi:hypothetical protein
MIKPYSAGGSAGLAHVHRLRCDASARIGCGPGERDPREALAGYARRCSGYRPYQEPGRNSR